MVYSFERGERVKWLKLNLYKKVVALFMITIIPLLVIGYMINVSGESIIQKDIKESMDSRVRFYMNSFEMEMNRIIRMKQHYMVDNDIQTLIMLHPILSDIDMLYTVYNVGSSTLAVI
jgi:two-component system sensor histidine kinase YesM